jgi:hypothetical protein
LPEPELAPLIVLLPILPSTVPASAWSPHQQPRVPGCGRAFAPVSDHGLSICLGHRSMNEENAYAVGMSTTTRPLLRLEVATPTPHSEPGNRHHGSDLKPTTVTLTPAPSSEGGGDGRTGSSAARHDSAAAPRRPREFADPADEPRVTTRKPHRPASRAPPGSGGRTPRRYPARYPRRPGPPSIRRG